MSRVARPNTRAEKARHHDKKLKAKVDKTPCDRPPEVPSGLVGEFKKAKGGKRHNHWELHTKWSEVQLDTSGNTVSVGDYKLEVEHSADGVEWFKDGHRYKVPAFPGDPFSGTDAGDLFTLTAHGFSDGDEVELHGSHLPDGVDADTTYFIVSANPDDFQLSLTEGGSAIALTSDGSGKIREADTKIRKVVKGIHGKLAYRFRVRAFEHGDGCHSKWSDYEDVGTPNDVPPAPHDVRILRASHGIRIRWKAPHHQPDDDEDLAAFTADNADPDDTAFHQDIAYFTVRLWSNPDFGPIVAFTADGGTDTFTATAHGFADGDWVMLRDTDEKGEDLPEGTRPYKLYYLTDTTTDTFKLAKEEDGDPVALTSDGAGEVMWGLVRMARHVHHHHHIFRIDADDFDEDTIFYAEVASVSDHRSKSAYIPATAPTPNDDPDATPTGRRPEWHRIKSTFNIPGSFQVGVYNPPNRFEDDYILRRLTGVVDTPGTGGATKVDIVVDSGSGYVSIFDDDDTDMLTFPAGDDDGSTKAIHNRNVDRGDHYKLKVFTIDGTAPEDGTIHLIADRRKADP